MHWKTKARIQNLISKLPSEISYALYYWMQRKFGGLRTLYTLGTLSAAVETWKRIQLHGVDPADKVFFEVGTGRAALVPLAYWLMGAKKTITIDLNPYIKSEIMIEHLSYIVDNKKQINELFGSLIREDRLEMICKYFKENTFSDKEYFKVCHIEYISPGDASETKLGNMSIDFHTSNAVFEHIPKKVLENILVEGNRIIKDNGIFLHKIDYSDHFSHSDKSISAINFLQYSDYQWKKYAGNRYMYMNRLRHDDFLELFEDCGHEVISDVPNVDKEVLELLKSNKVSLDKKFSLKGDEVLSITNSWIVSKKVSNTLA
ncbi:hypothetical protein N9I12_00045 [Gammaproteobacteria bacterium]|nr:hypothetical protein [Gammaproteobacteria bacterium]